MTMIVQMGRKKGVVDYTGKEVLPIKYDRIFSLSKRGFEVEIDKKRGILNREGEVVLPIIYHEIDNLSWGKSEQIYKVKIDTLYGIVNSSGDYIIPIQFDFIYPLLKLMVVSKDKKLGLYHRNGEVLQPIIFDHFRKSHTRESLLLIAQKEQLTGILDREGKTILAPIYKEIDYLHTTDRLVNPQTFNSASYLYLKDADDRYGVFEEAQQKIVIPVKYTNITQRFETKDRTYFVAVKGKKYGLLNDLNEVILDFKYEEIDLAHLYMDYEDDRPANQGFVVKRKGKYGIMNLDAEVTVPFQYTALAKLANKNIFKAEKNGHYLIIDHHNKIVNEGPFDEVALYEGEQTFTFYEGKMIIIDQTGQAISKPVPMQPHQGFTTFDALKTALVTALNDPDDVLLKEFALKISPSAHLLHYIKINIFSEKKLGYIQTNDVADKYYQELLRFKHSEWNSSRFDKTVLTDVSDYTLYVRGGIISNRRTGTYSSRSLEQLLKFSIKVNGYWISSYFMKRRF